MAGVHLPESKSFSTPQPRKRETAEEQKPVLPRSLSPLLKKLLPGFQVSESQELTRVVGQFLEANRAPWQGESDAATTMSKIQELT